MCTRCATTRRPKTSESSRPCPPPRARSTHSFPCSPALVRRSERSRRYAVDPPGVRTPCAYLLLREKVIKPLLAGVVRPCRRPPKVSAPLDHHYVALRQELHRTLTPEKQIAFARRFGELEISPRTQFALPGHPEILVLSNIIENGKPIGNADAGRTWHTDMSYPKTLPRGSWLYAREIPIENGRALGDTIFASAAGAFESLPA